MESKYGSKENVIPIFLQEDCEHAVIEAKKKAAVAGFGNTEQVLISTAVSELATNIIRYAGKGEIYLTVIKTQQKSGIVIEAIDNGPGIQDIGLALQDHFTTTRGSLGLGLSSVRRIMDEFEIESSQGMGTRIVARKWRNDVGF
ncbi:MAG: anti-sigma regulatory factor [Firmicutes bacterium]|nr:anti-sigma regulatory factor [Bacillota bacterium]